MRKKSLVIGDIARELKVSITTVSFILNGKAAEKRISAEVANRVLEYVKEVNYTPNHLAKSLRTGKTNLIGLIVEDISNPFFANIARLIEEIAYERGFRIIYCSSDNDTVKTAELIKVFRDRQVDAYIITPTPGTQNQIEALLHDKQHVVLFDRYFPEVNTNYVAVENAASTRVATRHLIERGYKNIAFVTLQSDQTQMKERLNGYKQAIKEAGLKPYIFKLPYQDDSRKYLDSIQGYLSAETNLDAVFFATNYLGISGLEAINVLKIKIPGQLGVISFDDHDLFRLHSPSITAVAQPIEEMSQQLINILMSDIDSKEQSTDGKKIKFPAKLVIRESTAPKQMASASPKKSATQRSRR